MHTGNDNKVMCLASGRCGLNGLSVGSWTVVELVE